MTSTKARSVAPSTHPALELIALARLSPEVVRRNLRALLLANPNYFGNLSASSFTAVLQIQEDTTYECVGGVGYNARLKQLHATIQIKQYSGYSGDGCGSGGSKEYVRFYLSDDGGTTWEDQGLRTFEVFDVPDLKPIKYTVSMQVSTQEELRLLQKPHLLRVILSWNSPPPPREPGWTPVWGNVAEAETRIESSRFVPLNAKPDATDMGSVREIGRALEINRQPAMSNIDSSLYLHAIGKIDHCGINDEETGRYSRRAAGACP